MAAETQYTAHLGAVTISTANSGLDGTGTLGTVLRADSNGTIIKTVIIKAQTNTTQGMIRLFVTSGANTRLLLEIEIPAITKSSRDSAYYNVIDLDYCLKSGDELKASTQNAETFNVIAEGFNWAYYATSVRPDSTQFTANTGTVTVSTANANLDGTGTLGTVLTAGAAASFKGCMIESIVIKAQVTTTPGMIRLFIQDTSSTFTKLLTEVPVPAVTKSATARSFSRELITEGSLSIPAGYKLLASTENAQAFNVIAEGLDWKYPA